MQRENDLQKQPTHEVLSVPRERWTEAQKWEGEVWIDRNSGNKYIDVGKKFLKALLGNRSLFWKYLRYRDFYCGDDDNYWWQEKFDNYALLPRATHRAIEVGCGPYSNIRLISQARKIDEIVCADPLIRTYARFSHTWISNAIKTNRITVSDCRMESIDFQDASFDLAVSINVLDHVQDFCLCLKELLRITRPGGYIVLGQDLTNAEDLEYPENREDVGHPIKIMHETLDAVFDTTTRPLLRRVLAREEGRAPKYHYGTYIFIGQRALRE